MAPLLITQHSGVSSHWTRNRTYDVRRTMHDSGARLQRLFLFLIKSSARSNGMAASHRQRPKVHSKDANGPLSSKIRLEIIDSLRSLPRDQHGSRKQRLPHNGESCILFASAPCLRHLCKFIWSIMYHGHGPCSANSLVSIRSDLSVFYWHLDTNIQ
jgi:hypothetical protein